MAVRPILIAPDPVLLRISAPVEQVTDDVRALITDMIDTMYEADGIGLAAIQIGVPLRILITDVGGKDAPRAPRVFINPELTPLTDEQDAYREGCLSVPKAWAEVRRPQHIRARYLNAEGTECEEELHGLQAVCLQHELDHLNGILFIDHLPKLQRSNAARSSSARWGEVF